MEAAKCKAVPLVHRRWSAPRSRCTGGAGLPPPGIAQAHSIAKNGRVGVDYVVRVPTFTRRDSRCAGSSMNLWNNAANAIANAAANNTAHGFPSVR